MQPTVSPLVAGLRCRCPRCGKGSLFVHLLNMRERCEDCGLGYKFVDPGDGPTVFAIFILGPLCLGGALIAEFRFGAPWWMQIVIWGILTPVMAVILLRFLKAALIALEFTSRGRSLSND